MRVRVRGTLSRVKARAGALRSSHGSPPWLRLLPLACILIIITALGILAISEMSMLGKQGTPPVMGGGGAAARIMPGRVHKHVVPHQQKPTPTAKGMVFKMEPLLRRNALSVELWTQISLNRVRSLAVARIIEEESSITKADIVICQPIPMPDCPRVPPDLNGLVDVKRWLQLQSELEKKGITATKHPLSIPGGSWSPPHCTSRHSIAVIIPYRNRQKQLALLMKYLPPLLKRQEVNYKLFVIEQTGNDTYNKGILMNAGFLTALDRPAHGVMYHCFIFHDVDLLLEDERTMYTCPQQPRHLSVAVNELGYKLPYRILVGGVFAIKTEHFLRVNGYSNLYWGWGGEDDDMGYRVEHVMSSISRPPEWIARYTMMQHEKRRPLSRKVRWKLLRTSWRRYRLDGLNTVQFALKDIVEEEDFTRVYIDVGPPPTTYKVIQEEEDSKKS